MKAQNDSRKYAIFSRSEKSFVVNTYVVQGERFPGVNDKPLKTYSSRKRAENGMKALKSKIICYDYGLEIVEVVEGANQ